MAVTNYFTVDGQIQGEETGGTFTGYVPDALGSVTATKPRTCRFRLEHY